MTGIEKAIQKFGTGAALGRALGFSKMTISNWKKTGIPPITFVQFSNLQVLRHMSYGLTCIQIQQMHYQAKRRQPNNHRGYLPMENAIARKLDPPEINPVEIESVLLNRLASVGQKSYAEHMGISESTVSRRKAEGYFCNMAKELAFLGIQAAPPEAVLVSRNYLTAVEILADAGLKAERARPDALGWD